MSSITNSYILNKEEMNKNYYERNKYLNTRPEIIRPSNYEKDLLDNCKMDISVDNTIINNNIMNGGVFCKYKPRIDINIHMNNRALMNYNFCPTSYSENVNAPFEMMEKYPNIKG